MNDSERDQLLARLDERTCHFMKVLTKHLDQHWVVTLMALGALVSAVGAVIIGFVR